MTAGRWARSAARPPSLSPTWRRSPGPTPPSLPCVAACRRPGAPSGAPPHSSGQSRSAFRGDGTKLLTAALPAGLLDLHLVPADRLAHCLDVLGALGPDDDLLAQ